ncbi:MAG: hypothetical protein LBR41_02265 [Rickettsiales bacterium]|jgi:hypothetical protein|nr:hypothetical protein [Rickettsiales bacterium]
MYEEQPFLRGYSHLKIPIVSADGVPAWPEMFGHDKIAAMRDAVGHRHFSSQMMLEYVAMEKTRLDPGALHFYNGEFDARKAQIGTRNQEPGTNQITGVAAYWDPSGGARGADNSVIALIYRDDKNRIAFLHEILYLTVAENDTHPMNTQCEHVLDFMTRFGLRSIGIEVNGIGNSLPEILRDTAARRGISPHINRVINRTRKENRILDAIEPLMTTGRLYAHERIQRTPIISEMLGWSPVGYMGHDDGLDAVAGALMMQPAPVRPTGFRARPIQARTDFKI